PTKDPLQAGPCSGNDIFVSLLNPAGSMFVYSTCLGASGYVNGLAVDARNVYLTGSVPSFSIFPITSALQPGYGGGISDAFVTKLWGDAAAVQVLYFPQFVVGGGFTSILTLANTGSSSATENLILLDQAGNLSPVPLNEPNVLPEPAASGNRPGTQGS